MATLNISLPDQLRDWVAQQVKQGEYSSASDYLRDLIRNDKRQQEQSAKWLKGHLEPILTTPEDEFQSLNADDIKARARKRLNNSGGDE
ncbi:type II toxin-antitoxin system ParD family antitoxin [Endozoicomonas sp. ALB091]|uniref:type II toxin-antitoxin system ParD family antitoxin n=1 Tax=Endozoicomonas sp. ALB091 TaxID=3403073 RepID=UPI003BB745CE